MQIKTGEAISVVSLVGIAGDCGIGCSSLTLHLQSTHLQAVASGLQQHPLDAVGVACSIEQQLCSETGTGVEQHEDSTADATTLPDSEALHSQPESELKANDCKPIAAVANTKSVAIIERRIVEGVFISAVLPK